MAIQVSTGGGVQTITLDRPDFLNSFTREMHGEFAEALRAARKPEVRAVVITGSGRGFSAGQDLDEVREEGGGNDDRLRRHYNPNVLAVHRLEKPVIAAVNGVCAGAGLSLASACDIRIASSKARFVPAFINLGLIPDSGGSWFLPRVIGYSRALEWLVSGRHLKAEEALDIGLVTEVVEPEELMERATAMASTLASWPGEGVGATKRLLQQGLELSLEQQLDREVQVQAYAASTPAYIAAMEEFLAK